MTKPNQMIYTRLEFTLADDERDNWEYRKAILHLLERFGGYLIGFQAEDLRTGEFYADDVRGQDALDVVRKIFPEPKS